MGCKHVCFDNSDVVVDDVQHGEHKRGLTAIKPNFFLLKHPQAHPPEQSTAKYLDGAEKLCKE